MGYRSYKHISVEISAQSGLFLATTYVGTLEKLSSDTRFLVTLRNAYESAPGDIEMTYKDGTWTIASVSKWTLITVENPVDSCRFYKNEATRQVWAIIDARPNGTTKQWTLPTEVPRPIRNLDTAVWCMANNWAGLGTGTFQIKADGEMNFTGLQSTFAISGSTTYPY